MFGRKPLIDWKQWREDNKDLFARPSQPLPPPSQPLFEPQQERLTTTQQVYAVPKQTIDTQPTRIVPAVQAQHARKLSYPPHTAYRSTQGYLLRLYGAIMAYQDDHRHLPSALCISSRIEPMVAHEFFRFTGVRYNARFYIVHPAGLGGVKSFPILTENDLPPLFQLAIGSIDIDLVIALGEY